MSEVTTKRQLKMHPKLLLDVIGRQAGSLDKAMLEGGMNAVEAVNALKQNGGNCCDETIYFTYTREDGKAIITIQDFGKGITSIEEIENFFETFGTPHDESEHKIYAQFRMGRGQMFNFGRNVWRTGTFELIVDVEKNGLEWELKKDLSWVDGCHITIELYDKYKDSFPANTVDCLKEEVRKQMKFVSNRVMFNGEQINMPPQDCNWDFEDEFAYYLFNTGDKLTVYNLGVYVNEKWYAKGLVVSKHQLKLNFPRNDVMADCPVWFHISEVVRKNTLEKTRKKSQKLSINERRSILRDIRDGRVDYTSTKGARVLQTAQNKHISLNMFLKNTQPWTIALVGDRQADRMIEAGTHLVLARDMLDAIGYVGDDSMFFSWLFKTLIETRNISNSDKDEFLTKYKLFETMAEATSTMNRSCKIIANSDLSVVEKRVLKVLQGFNCWNDRIIRIGISSGAIAWTDGHSFINIDKNWLKALYFGSDYDIARLFSILVHEMAHDDDTSYTDIHGEDFYEKFHEIATSRYNNPFSHIAVFKNAMRSALRQERIAREKKRKEKEMKKMAKKLGVS